MSDRERLIEAFREDGWGTGDCEPPCNCRGCWRTQNRLATIALRVLQGAARGDGSHE